MGDTSIRVSKETKHRLDLFKSEGESYEDVIRRLTERDKWAGFGVLAETEGDTRAGMSKMRSSMRDGMAEDLEADDE
ncbi:MAG: antitoxin VapB family protein [Halodesulfurarchaeum sp.]|nr:antitoxin VapB family protein [Halodesulfurarchaeum sp.]